MLILIVFLSICHQLAWSWPTEVPFWPKYPSRSIQVLDGDWEFQYIANLNIETYDPKTFKSQENVTVPNAFDVAQPGISGRRGTGIYRTKITTTPNKPVLLYFTACAFFCSIYVDGQYIGNHTSGGYQPFWKVVPVSSSATREILVLSDNRWNKTTAPTYTGGDFYFYGGFLRSLIVHEQPSDTYLLQVETFTVDVKKGTIDLRVLFAGKSISTALLSFAWDSSPSNTPTSYTVTNGVVSIKSLQVPNPKPWNIKTPNLHTLKVTYHSTTQELDAIQVRFGLRVLSVTSDKDARLAINGEVQKLVGINRHTMWPSTGAAVRLDQVQIDLQLIIELGANYIRGAHYPQDQRFLDLCDENGLVVWEEALGPGVSVNDLTNPYFLKNQEEAMNEMISASINHPCVIFHGFFNEGPSNNAKACPGYQKSSDIVKQRVGNPPTRLVTWASNQEQRDVCFDYADVISFNGYPGWYDHPGNLSYVVPYWQNQVNWIIEHHPTKPFFISETGGAGIFEWMNKTQVFWSQTYQTALLNVEANFVVKTSRLSGLTIWQFSDIKVDACSPCDYKPHPPSLETPWDCAYISTHCGRPGGENHKGLVDFWRRKKNSYITVQSIYKNLEKI